MHSNKEPTCQIDAGHFCDIKGYVIEGFQLTYLQQGSDYDDGNEKEQQVLSKPSSPVNPVC